MDHSEPFHASINVVVTRPLVESPTATQLDALMHDTPSRAFSSAGPVLGLGTIDHTDPFHASMRVWSLPPAALL
jgi:hypothetical protein